MKTETLIDTLVADATAKPTRRLLPVWPFALAAILVEALLFLPTLEPRADFMPSLVSSWRFDMKFVAAAALTLASVGLLARLVRPRPRVVVDSELLWLAAPFAILAGMVLAELASVPAAAWPARAFGSNAVLCLMSITGFGLPVVPLLAEAVRRGAPTRPVLSGGMAGLAAAGIAALFYAAHCTDDSPLFVALWYGAASLVLVGAGALWGRLALRW